MKHIGNWRRKGLRIPNGMYTYYGMVRTQAWGDLLLNLYEMI